MKIGQRPALFGDIPRYVISLVLVAAISLGAVIGESVRLGITQRQITTTGQPAPIARPFLA